MNAEQIRAEGATSLTVETIQRAIEKIRDAPMRVCGVTEPHVVGPKVEGWTTCANCFGPAFVE